MTNETLRISRTDQIDETVAIGSGRKAESGPPGYLVIVIAKGTPITDTTSRPVPVGRSADANFALRMTAVLESWNGALWRDNGAEGIVVLPVGNGASGGAAGARQAGIAVAEKIMRAVRAGIATVSSCGQRDRLPTVLAEASRCLAVAAAAGLRGAFATEHLVIETTLLVEPGLAEQCARLVAPLRDGPDLLQTLEALYQCDLDRSKTAKKLFVHRHTVNYRLGRIESICGLNPTSARGIQIFNMALVASRICEARFKAGQAKAHQRSG